MLLFQIKISTWIPSTQNVNVTGYNTITLPVMPIPNFQGVISYFIREIQMLAKETGAHQSRTGSDSLFNL